MTKVLKESSSETKDHQYQMRQLRYNEPYSPTKRVITWQKLK